MIWFVWILYYINHCKLFNAKSSFYIYIKYIRFGLVRFYGISIIVGYLMPNPLYKYMIYMICRNILLTKFLYESELIFFTHS